MPEPGPAREKYCYIAWLKLGPEYKFLHCPARAKFFFVSIFRIWSKRQSFGSMTLGILKIFISTVVPSRPLCFVSRAHSPLVLDETTSVGRKSVASERSDQFY